MPSILLQDESSYEVNYDNYDKVWLDLHNLSRDWLVFESLIQHILLNAVPLGGRVVLKSVVKLLSHWVIQNIHCICKIIWCHHDLAYQSLLSSHNDTMINYTWKVRMELSSNLYFHIQTWLLDIFLISKQAMWSVLNDVNNFLTMAIQPLFLATNWLLWQL